MKKINYLSTLLFTFVLGACSGNNQTTNTAPSIVGVKDIQCIVNTEIDFLDGIAALDKEDGDITPNLDINIVPQVDVIDGRAIFKQTGDYAVNYTISDSKGRTTQKKSTVSVKDREKYVSFDMPQGFEKETKGQAYFEECGMVDGHFIVRAKGHEVAEDVIITRNLTLNTHVSYTFNYEITSYCYGKVSALVNNVLVGEMNIIEGYNKLSFKHTINSENNKEDAMVSLCLGAIESDIDLTIDNIYIEYPQEEGKIVDLTTDFSFSGRVEPRIDPTLAPEGNAWSEPDGKTAVLEVTRPCSELFAAGMFVNTGIQLKENTTYRIYLDIEATYEEVFNVIIQKDQWDEKRIEGFYEAKNGKNQMRECHITEETEGALWLYVEGGIHVNNIKIRNFKVEEVLNATGKDKYPILDYSEYHNQLYEASFTSSLGGFKYHIKDFAFQDGDQKVQTAPFYVNGSGANYVLTFKARASEAVEVIVAAPVSGGWNPAITWNRLNFSKEERIYTFFLNGSGSDRDYVIVWQFGSSNNQQYHNVDIEVSEVQINLRNRELDG